MFGPIIDLVKSLAVPLPIIAFVWAVVWTVFRYISDNQMKYALSDLEQLKKLEPELRALKEKGSLYQNMHIRTITLLETFDISEIEFLLSRKKVKANDVKALKRLKRSKWLKVFFNEKSNCYQDDFPNRPFLFLFSILVIFFLYAALLVAIYAYWGEPPVGYTLVSMMVALAIVELPVIGLFEKMYDFHFILKKTDLFVP